MTVINTKVKNFYTGLKIIALIVCTLHILACASAAKAPIESRSQPPTKKINTHIVEKGDTLYSIAWRYETDYKQLAANNGIKPPYVIFAGQKIRLNGSPVAIANNTAETVKPQSTSQSSSRTVTTTSTGSTRTATVNRPSTRVASTSPSRAATTSNVPAAVKGWNWPLNGKIVKTYGSSDLTKGITIDSSSQKDVKAAAEGVVVYSGSGVRGYGNFLILKHSDLYLSAYAYNSKLLAKEGDQIRQGQKIAVAGEDMDGKPRLYFEIRKDGKPVDPVRYLPKR